MTTLHPSRTRRGRRASMTLGALLALGAAHAAAPAGVFITNTAQMDTLGEIWPSPTVTLEVAAVCSVRVTLTAPPTNVSVGETTSAVFSVFNDGNTEITFPLTSQVVAGQGALSGPESVTIPAAQSANITLNMTPSQAGVMAATLQASCPEGSLLNGPGSGQARAAFTASDASALTLTKAVEPTTSEDPALDTSPLTPQPELLERKPSELVRYHLTVHNDSRSATTADIRDTLPRGLTAVAASPAAQSNDGQTMNWTLSLAPGETRVIHLVARLPDMDDGKVDNVFSAQTPGRTFTSNVASVSMWDPRLAIQKTVSIPEARVGSVLNYAVTTSNASRQATVQQVSITDTMPRGLQLLDSSLRLNGAPVTDMDSDPQVIRVMADDLAPGQQHVLTYQAVVTAQANDNSDLINVAVAQGLNANKPVTDEVTSSAIVRVISAGLADIIGRVYVDTSGDRRYQRGEPLVSGARVILAGGQQAVTDAEGRYHFARLVPGQYAVAIDPRTINQFPAPVEGDLGRSGSRLVSAWGLTPADFPLMPSRGAAQGLRQTTVTLRQNGTVIATLLKTVTPTSRGAIITYRVNGVAGTRLQLSDPLPAGAVLVSGSQQVSFTLDSAGWSSSTELTTNLPPEALTTDPTFEVLP